MTDIAVISEVEARAGRRPGRPSRKENYNHIVNTRLTASQYARFEAYLERTGEAPASFIRRSMILLLDQMEGKNT